MCIDQVMVERKAVSSGEGMVVGANYGKEECGRERGEHFFNLNLLDILSYPLEILLVNFILLWLFCLISV